MSKSEVYIAGVGFSPAQSGSSSSKDSVASSVSAATKALLDAGVTYDDVTKGLSSVGSEAFKAFDEGSITVDEAGKGSELDNAFRLVKEKGAQCVLMLAGEKSGAIALVVVSESFLWSRPYLKDSSASIRITDASTSKVQAKEGLSEVCQIVWNFRGWSDSNNSSSEGKSQHYKGKSKQIFELNRADGEAAPKWKDVEHKQDGKHRLRHNPAKGTKEVSQEDLEAVRALGKKHKDQVKFKRIGGDRAALAKL